jgi:hypothetical protein
MAEDLVDHRALRDDGDEPQGPALTPRAVHHIQGKDPLQQPGPASARRPGDRLRVHPLLAWGGDDAPMQVAVWRQTAAIAHQMDVREGHQCRQIL